MLAVSELSEHRQFVYKEQLLAEIGVQHCDVDNINDVWFRLNHTIIDGKEFRVARFVMRAVNDWKESGPLRAVVESTESERLVTFFGGEPVGDWFRCADDENKIYKVYQWQQ